MDDSQARIGPASYRVKLGGPVTPVGGGIGTYSSDSIFKGLNQLKKEIYIVIFIIYFYYVPT